MADLTDDDRALLEQYARGGSTFARVLLHLLDRDTDPEQAWVVEPGIIVPAPEPAPSPTVDLHHTTADGRDLIIEVNRQPAPEPAVPPCRACNDEGRVHIHDGEDAGPCPVCSPEPAVPADHQTTPHADRYFIDVANEHLARARKAEAEVARLRVGIEQEADSREASNFTRKRLRALLAGPEGTEQ